jgi:uncharacterized membrane protein YheB (UPF0754 family)
MSNLGFDPSFIVPYLAPPMVGAFIGYLTNRIAIRMLFRPLRAYHLGSLRIPMTPGVIPAKRHDLAENMGEVVGDHLLTSREIGHALAKEAFQNHLYGLIKARIEGLMAKDLGPLDEIVPAKFKVYLDIGQKTISYQLKNQIRGFVQSEMFSAIVDEAVDDRVHEFVRRDIDSVFSPQNRERVYDFIEASVARMLASESMAKWLDDIVREKVFKVLQQGKTITDIMPASLLHLLLETMENQVPQVLAKLGDILGEESVRNKIVVGACIGVNKFIDSLGSMADMVRNFLKMETVEEKIHEYLCENHEKIAAWLQSPEMQAKIVAILRERAEQLFNKPIADIVRQENEQVVDHFCRQCSSQLYLLCQSEEVSGTVTAMVKANIEDHLDGGAASVEIILSELLGRNLYQQTLTTIRGEIHAILRSGSTLHALEAMVDSLFAAILSKKLGKLGNIVPVGVREGVIQSLLKMTSAMLAMEVPGIVQSLNIRKIVTEKINSLDLLRLEGLLLSIMEEQFKYINLFGALLGFLIGCLNLFFVHL